MALWKSLKAKALLARQLSLRDWFTLTEAWWVLLVFYLVLSRASFKRLEALSRSTITEDACSAGALAAAHRLQRLVHLASRLHWASMTCLIQAFSLRWMASRRGIPSEIRIGAAKTAAGMHAHAWVEIAGQAVGEPADIAEKFIVLTAHE